MNARRLIWSPGKLMGSAEKIMKSLSELPRSELISSLVSVQGPLLK